MANILTIGYSVEGSTDTRFLEGIIQRTFENMAFDCETDIEVFPLSYIPSPKLEGFVINTIEIAKQAAQNGIQVLCIHADADAADADGTLAYRINPAFENIENYGPDPICKNLVAIIPIHMSEAWMLADTAIFKREIHTTKSNQDLGITRQPERIADPKELIQNAIRIAQSDLPKKRRELTIGEIYQPLGQKVPLESLRRLSSYNAFAAAVRNAFVKLNYLH